MIYTENYQLRKPVIGVDDADVKDLNYNSDRIDEIMHSSQISLADAYDLNSTYNTGDVVMYEFLMYRCLEDNVTGVWDPEKWTRTTAGEESGGGADLDIYGEASGTAEASFSDGAEASLVECEIGIVPTQDLHGYSKPWAGGAGKNKLNVNISSQTLNDVVFTVNSDGSISTSGIASATFNIVIGNINVENGVEYFTSGCPSGGSALTYELNIAGVASDYGNGGNWESNITAELGVRIRINNNVDMNDKVFYPMVRTSGDSTYEPYSNICPISGHTDVTVTVASTSGGSGDDTTVSLGRTVYGGTLDVTTGELITTHILKNITSTDISDNGSSGGLIELYINGTTNKKNGQTNMYCNNLEVYASPRAYAIRGRAGSTSVTFCLPLSDVPDFNSAKTWVNNNPIQLVYELATPQTFNLTPTQVETLLGQNHVSHDGEGTISLVYIKKDSTIIPNPSDAEVPLTGLEISGKRFKITDARIPAPPTTNGAYVLTVTVSGGTPTYSWENA